MNEMIIAAADRNRFLDDSVYINFFRDQYGLKLVPNDKERLFKSGIGRLIEKGIHVPQVLISNHFYTNWFDVYDWNGNLLEVGLEPMILAERYTWGPAWKNIERMLEEYPEDFGYDW